MDFAGVLIRCMLLVLLILSMIYHYSISSLMDSYLSRLGLAL